MGRTRMYILVDLCVVMAEQGNGLIKTTRIVSRKSEPHVGAWLAAAAAMARTRRGA